MEKDFYNYLKSNDWLLTSQPQEADWHYLPVGWTDYFINANFSQDQAKMDLLEREVQSAIIDSKKTFTICQHDDGIPFSTVNVTVFLASRKGATGIDIPLMSKPLGWVNFFRRFIPKIYITSFIGRTSTHPVRSDIPTIFSKLKGVKIINGYQGTVRYFINTLLSKSVLAPRGYGGDSFRFYEAMQVGSVPILIGDIDTRPFKNYIDWKECSFYFKNSLECKNYLEKATSKELKNKGRKAFTVWKNYFSHSSWCQYVIHELDFIAKH